MSRLLPDEIEKLSNYLNLQKQVAELTVELNGMTKAKDTFYNDMLLYKKSCGDLIKLRDELYNKIDELTGEREKWRSSNETLANMVKRQDEMICQQREELANMRMVLDRKCECGGKCKC